MTRTYAGAAGGKVALDPGFDRVPSTSIGDEIPPALGEIFGAERTLTIVLPADAGVEELEAWRESRRPAWTRAGGEVDMLTDAEAESQPA